MKKRSDLAVMLRLVGLVKPLMGFMALAIAMGVAGFLCAQFIPIFGGLAIVKALGGAGLPALGVLFACMGVFALARGVLRYAEQACNHYIASNCWPLSGIRYSERCAAWPPPSWTAGTRAI